MIELYPTISLELSNRNMIEFKYNRFYLNIKNNIVSKGSNKYRYLISGWIDFDNKKVVINKVNDDYKIYFNTKSCRFELINGQIVDGKYFLTIEVRKISKLSLKHISFTRQDKISNQIVDNSKTNLLYNKMYEDDKNRIIQKLKLGNNILSIVDKFTYYNLKNKYNVINLKLSDVYLLDDILRENHYILDIKFFFLESAWLGEDNTWRDKVVKPSQEAQDLLNILRKNKIKVVFFNKEDPFHFNSFKHLVHRSHYTLTTAQECIDDYKKITKENVSMLQYFLNEKEYNIFKNKVDVKNKNILFAGSYYYNFPERNEFLKEFINSFNVDIYDRNLNSINNLNKFPNQFKSIIKGGGLNQFEINKIIEKYKYVISLNSIVDSQTMIARRFFELIAMGKIQIANYSPAVDKLNYNSIIFSETNDINDLKQKIQKNNITRKELLNNSFDILRKNSSEIVFNKIEEDLNIKTQNNMVVYIEVTSFRKFELFIINFLSSQKKKNNYLFVVANAKVTRKIESSIYMEILDIFFNYKSLEKLNVPFINLDENYTYNKNYLIDAYLATKGIETSNTGIKFAEFDKISDYIQNNKTPDIYINYLAFKEQKNNTIQVNKNYEKKLIDSNDVNTVFTNIYPTYQNLYRNAFVHQRVRYYNLKSNNIVILMGDKNHFYVFDHVLVLYLNHEGFKKYFDNRVSSDKIFIHFLSPQIKFILDKYAIQLKKNVWVHGVEGISYERRSPFLFETNENIKFIFKNRKKMWQEVFEEDSYKLIFISNWIYSAFQEDMNYNKKPIDYNIISNPIDTEFYSLKDKDYSKIKILSIRPYASKTYANDLTVKTILELSKKPYFSELEFTIIGRGQYFDQIIKPLKDKNFKNVIILETFLTRDEIKEYHKKNNIFLCPTRQDSQGVSMCEAASSGLVVITNDNSAIREFMNDDISIIVPDDDVNAMVKGIESLYYNKDLLEKMSKGANITMNKELNIKYICDLELKRT